MHFRYCPTVRDCPAVYLALLLIADTLKRVMSVLRSIGLLVRDDPFKRKRPFVMVLQNWAVFGSVKGGRGFYAPAHPSATILSPASLVIPPFFFCLFFYFSFYMLQPLIIGFSLQTLLWCSFPFYYFLFIFAFHWHLLVPLSHRFCVRALLYVFSCSYLH